MKFPASRRARVILIATAVTCVAAFTVLLLVYGEGQPKHPPKVVANNVSGRPTVCLASDSATATKSATVAKVWAAIQDAAKPNAENAQQLTMPVSDPAQAQSYLAGLISQRCTLIVTVGAPFGQAIAPLAKLVPTIQFTAVEPTSSTTIAGATVVTADEAPDRIRQQMQSIQESTPIR
ncbi:hypothetical protein AB0K51_15615 [Kitasatospora sp. NPDC049285]|uniref:hypothetical protein n=1 Tax=Kitasatospora sp. NPDC049285 TaxID=3157096 RepID=UPI00341B5275